MRLATILCIAVALFSVSFAACAFDAQKALEEVNEGAGWYKNNPNMSVAKMFLGGKRANISIDGVSYYVQYKNGNITRISPARGEFSAQLDSCTALGIWNGSIGGKEALSKKLVKIKANNFFDGILLGMLERFLPS